MQCPIDNVDLVMSSREGIEIDYCPKCRGVWLDRGELDKIIERSSQISNFPQQAENSYQPSYPQQQNTQHYNKGYDKKRKKRNFLEDLFELGD